jgi:multiple sugar transport system permease protein
MDDNYSHMAFEKYTSPFRNKDGKVGSIRAWINDHFMLVVLGPTLSFLAILVLFPLFYLVDTSLRARQGLGGSLEFAGLENYQTVLNDSLFYLALEHTLVYTVGVVTIAFVIGMITALAINALKSDRHSQFAMTAVLLAWAIPSIVTALVFRFMLNSETGVIYHALLELGFLAGTGGSILADPTAAMISIIVADAWARSPFATLLLLAGLQQIPERLYEAARVDGASSFRMFRDITLPQLKPQAGVALLIMTMFSFRTFSIAFGLTGGGPGNATEVLATLIYRSGIGELRMGYASALSVMMIFFTLIIVTLYVKFYQGEAEEAI